jgi:hypothetical protein
MIRFSSFLAGALLCSTYLFAQNPTPNMPVDEVTKLITYSEVVEAKGLSKDTIYNRTYRWFQSFYKNPAQAIKLADKENQTIEGGYRFTVKRPDPAAKKDPKPMVDGGMVNYKMKIMCKDGRYKYEITNISWQQTSYYPIERWMETSSPSYKPEFAGYLQQTDDYVNQLIQSLADFSETTPVKKKEDW